MRILIVEDDFLSRQILSKYLREYGDCDVVINGNEAIEAFKLAYADNQRFELVCLDIMMPGMDGHETLEAIRNIEKQHNVTGLAGVKILMTTALGDSKNIMKAFREQCEGYIVKPVSKEKITRELEKLGIRPSDR